MDKVIRFAGKGFLRAQAEESWREAMARAGGKGAKSASGGCASARLKLFADSGYIRFQIQIRQKFGYPDPDPDLVIEFGCFPFAIHIQFEYEFGYPYLRF